MGCAGSKLASSSTSTAPAPETPVPKTPKVDSAMANQWLTESAPRLTLEAADEMASAAIKEAKARGFNDLSVYVLDAAGRTIVSKTMINCPNLPPKLAHAKAMLCVSTHSNSRALRDKYVPDRTPQLIQMSIVGMDVEQPLAAFPGGVLCRDQNKNIVGAIGVSGASADEDEHCALAGAHAVGLITEPAASVLK